MPDISPLWAEYCSISTLAPVLQNARIIEKEKPMSLNLIMLMIGPPGIKKSLPMFAWTYPILKSLGEKIGRELLIPSRSTVEGLIKYVNDTEVGQPLRDAGIIIRDEFSGLFNQLRNANWQSDGMEFISEMYDGIYQKRVTTTHGLNDIETLYANLISATTPYFIEKLDSEFFIQGTGNRFLYCYLELKDYTVEEIDPVDYFRQSWGNERKGSLDKHTTRLEKLYNKNITEIYVDGEAALLYSQYKKNCEMEWKAKGVKDPYGWAYHPIKRYPELALKLSGLYSISAFIDSIPDMPTNPPEVIVLKEHMEKAISLVEENRKSFKKIVELKDKIIPREKPTSLQGKARAIAAVFIDVEGKILTSGSWFDKQDITENTNLFNKLKQICLDREWVKEIDHNELTEEEVERLGIQAATKVYRYVES